MPMGMAVRLAAIPVEIVLVLVMRVVDVWVGVLEWLMRVHVLVTLGQMQPVRRTYESGCQPERRRRRFAQ